MSNKLIEVLRHFKDTNLEREERIRDEAIVVYKMQGTSEVPCI